LQFRRGNRILPLPATYKTTSLLAYLLLHNRKPQSRERLATLFWGEVADERARHSLRTALAALRKDMGSDLLLSDRETVQVSPELPIWVDALELQQYADSAAPREYAGLQDALDLYQGDLLPDFYDEWILREREHYRALHLDLLLDMTQLMRSRSEYGRAVEYAERVLDTDPANERAHQHLIFCRLAMGDRNGALRQYEECRRMLQEDLAVDPSPATTGLYQWLAQAAFQTPEARITNLPVPLTSFVGRAREMARVKELLSQARLVSLTGAGGCGKTRLAIQVASDLVDSFRDGVWWVDLAPLRDASLVDHTLAKCLGVCEALDVPLREILTNSLRPRKTLLVLDNCDGLVDGVAQLAATLLSECPELKILATSREALGLVGEGLLRVPSLSFPMSPQPLPGERLEDYESVRLLLQRASALRSEFSLTAENAAAVAQICRRLDGIPLAIELAAARVKALSASQIAERLDDCFHLLSGGGRGGLPRHRTLRAVIDWSYSLLTQEEQTLLHWLSVFVGGWTLQAAEAVCADAIPSKDVVDLLSRLVDKSLVEVSEQPSSDVRYRMLETVRQYGLEQLSKANQTDAACRQHALYFAGLAEEAEHGLRGPQMGSWIRQIEAEHDNLRAALEWSVAREPPELGLRFAGGMGFFWRRRGYLSEGRGWLERLLARASGLPPPLRVQAMAQASWLARDLGNYEQAHALQEDALRILRASADKSGLVDVLIQGGLLAVYKNEPEKAMACFNECLVLSDELGFRWGRAMALVNLAHAALFDLQWNPQAKGRGQESFELFRELHDETEQAHALIILGVGAHYEHDDARARVQLEQAAAICRQAGDRRQLAWATTVLGLTLRWLGRVDEALPVVSEGLRLASELGERTIAVFALVFLALLAKDRGQVPRAVHLLSCAIACGESFGYLLSPFMQDVIRADVEGMRSSLGPQAFAEAWADGRALPFERTAQGALQEA
jgi:predicted ATPase/DNA-binding SARP family transcriptional activator